MQREHLLSGLSVFLVTVVTILPGASTPSVKPVTDTPVEHDGCAMFPENNLRFPVGFRLQGSLAPTGITEAKFNSVIDAVERVYAPTIQAAGGKLIFIRDWENPKVNASAERADGDRSWYVHMYGGLARHPFMTEDGFLVVACHEIGHHLGGAPHYSGEWASSEGEADYFATLKCLRAVLGPFDQRRFADHLVRRVSAEIEQRCEKLRSGNQTSDKSPVGLCLRTFVAADVLGRTLTDARNAKLREQGLPPLAPPDLSNPDRSLVGNTIRNAYPSLQCRLDTYIAGALCQTDAMAPMDASIANNGVCLRPNQNGSPSQQGTNSVVDAEGARPPCWYNQEENFQPENQDEALSDGQILPI